MMQIAGLSNHVSQTDTFQKQQMFQPNPGSNLSALLGQQILSVQKIMEKVRTNNRLSQDEKQRQLKILEEQLEELNNQKYELEEKRLKKQIEKQIKDKLESTVHTDDKAQSIEALDTSALTHLMTTANVARTSPEDADDTVYKIYTRLAREYNLSKSEEESSETEEKEDSAN